MGSLLFLVIVAVQFTSSLAKFEIPLRCFFQDGYFFNLFDPDLANTKIGSPNFGTVEIGPLNFNKDGWMLQAKNIKFEGLDDAVLEDIEFNFDTNVVEISSYTDMLITYDYKCNGSVFSQPISGEGLAKATIKNILVDLKMTFNVIDQDGKKYINLEDFDDSYIIRDRAEFMLSNLYYGDQEASDSMHELINENWEYITTAIGQDFIDNLSEVIFGQFKHYGLKVPLKDFSSC